MKSPCSPVQILRQIGLVPMFWLDISNTGSDNTCLRQKLIEVNWYHRNMNNLLATFQWHPTCNISQFLYEKFHR